MCRVAVLIAPTKRAVAVGESRYNAAARAKKFLNACQKFFEIGKTDMFKHIERDYDVESPFDWSIQTVEKK